MSRDINYAWQMPEWPNATVDRAALRDELAAFSKALAKVKTVLKSPEDPDFMAETMAAEAVRTSVMEGVNVDESVVMSSICRVLGVPYAPPGFTKDIRAEGVAQLMLKVRAEWNGPLSEKLILSWHGELLKGDLRGIAVGSFRTHREPMRVVRRTAEGEYEIRYEAPPSERVPKEMCDFIRRWKDVPETSGDVELKAALMHPHFESIHPFEDGNGRIGRALVAKTLAEGLGKGVVLPVSAIVSRHSGEYYDAINEASHSLDWTNWAKFFIPVLTETLLSFDESVRFVAAKKAYLTRYEGVFSERAAKAIRRILKDGLPGVAAGISPAKWVRLTKVSKPTATRDLADLVQCGALVPSGDGRNSRYDLNFNEPIVPINRFRNVPISEAVLKLVEETPGINRMRLAEAIGVDVKTIARSLDALAGQIKHRGSKKTGGYWRV